MRTGRRSAEGLWQRVAVRTEDDTWRRRRALTSIAAAVRAGDTSSVVGTWLIIARQH